jgi:hypothetical protein
MVGMQEDRLSRLKDLFLLGEIDHASFVAEKKRTEDMKAALHITEARSIIKFVQESNPNFLIGITFHNLNAKGCCNL